MSIDSPEAKPNMFTIIPAPSPTIAPGEPLDYNKRDGGGGMSDLGERVTRVEAGLDFLQKEVSEIKVEIKASRWWIIASVLAALAIIVAVIGMQGYYLREAINQHATEFRRDSDRNYDLALKALERSMGQPQPPQTPNQAPPSE